TELRRGGAADRRVVPMTGYRERIVEDVLSAVETALCRHFGATPERAAVSFLGVESIEVLRFDRDSGERTYVSLGMSRHPMTAADDVVRSADGPRAELLVQVHHPGPPDLWRQLAVLAAAPAVEGVVYRPGLVIDLGTPLADESRCAGGIVVSSSAPAV